MIKILLEKEKRRNEKMIAEYTKELECLPKGSIKLKVVNDNTYYYLNNRLGKKVISKYIGKNIEIIKEQLLRRKQIEEIIKKLKDENIKIIKMEELL